MSSFNKTVSQKLDKLSPAQIQRVFSELSNDRQMLFSIIDSVPTGIIIVDKEYKTLLANKMSRRRVPFSAGFPKDGELLWEGIADADIAAFIKNCCEKNSTNVSQDFSIATSGGNVRFVTISITPFVNAGELGGSIILVRDITEKRNQEILLHRMESLASLTNLAAGVAHEIKNPLGAISIHIQLLQKAVETARKSDGVLPDEKFMEKYLDVINEEIDNLNEVVMNFLFAVRPVNATLELLNPNSLIEKVLEFVAPEFNKKNIELKTELCKDAPRLMLDSKLFRDVVMNLAQNSIAAIEEKFNNTVLSGAPSNNKGIDCSGGVFEIRTMQKDDKFLILIKDNGNGMSQKTLEHIFEPYYTTKASGTGLGMTMVYKIIKEFSGDIRVESHEGEGTAFAITLPVPQTDTHLLTYAASETQGGGK